jgi:ATP-dependent Clp protease ATP-binding subunit ClpB
LLAQLGYDVTYGARPLKRVIQKYLVNPLSQELLASNFEDGDTIKVNVTDRIGLVFTK